jgi:hypothetical protein
VRRRAVAALLMITAVGGLAASDSDLGERDSLAAFGATVMARADLWYRQDLQYSQDHCYRIGAGYAPTDWAGVLGGCHWPYYRTDCSGFVSMAWNLPHSYPTPRVDSASDLDDLTRTIDKDQLSTGDALVAAGQHVRLFEKWTDSHRTRYLAYDFGATPVKHQEYRWGSPDDYRYTPVRYLGATR